ncbi:hypothetical protein [Streptomyces chartreusis]|uniref:hypothetical protein n=1 Tax=Streptomyces chartreusis TaxID=1969 RepID=UPI00363A6838
MIVLAAGHASRPAAGHLITDLLGRGDAAEHRAERYRLHALAARCALNVQSLNSGLMEMVKDRVGSILPPRDREEIEDLAGLGDWVVGLLPDAEQLRDRVALNTVRLLGRVRSVKARQKLRQCAAHPDPAVRSEVAKAWDLHPLQQYGEEVLDGAHLPDLLVDHPAKFLRLSRLGSVAKLTVRGSYVAEELDNQLPAQHIESLAIWDNEAIESLDFLRGRPGLRALELQNCPALRDFSAVRDLRLTALRLTGVVQGGIAPHPGVLHLEAGIENVGRLGDLEAWPNLRALTVEGYCRNPLWILRSARNAPQLTRIALGIDSLRELQPVDPLPRVERLMLTGLWDYRDTRELRRVFPGLRRLALGLSGPPGALDLRELHGMPDLRVELWSSGTGDPDIVGAEAFGERLRFHQLPHT